METLYNCAKTGSRQGLSASTLRVMSGFRCWGLAVEGTQQEYSQFPHNGSRYKVHVTSPKDSGVDDCVVANVQHVLGQ
eukprot:3692260-Amphidinium_carterae.1